MFDEIKKGWSIDDSEVCVSVCDKEVKAIIMNKKKKKKKKLYLEQKKLSTSVITRDERDDLPDSNGVLAGATSGKWKSRLLVIYVIYNSYLCVTC